MKAIVLTGLDRMEMVELPEPVLDAVHDVLLQVGSVGVCGSDVHYYRTGRIGSQVVRYPYRVGHEFAGTVLAVGPGVTRVSKGDRVAVEPAMSCGACDQCRADRRHTCRNLRFLGCPGQADGCLSERIAMPAACCYPVGPETTLDEAAVAEPLSIGVYSVKQAVPMPGARVAILGCGPIGLSVLLPALAQGAERVYVTDPIDARLAVARRAGAAWIGNPEAVDVVDAITAEEPLLLDAVFECCGKQEALDQAVRLLKPGGKLMLIGIPTVDRVSFQIDLLRRKEICVRNVRRQNECMREALDLIESGKIDVSFMITHRFPFEKTKEAFDLVAGYADGVVKAMIEVGGEGRGSRVEGGAEGVDGGPFRFQLSALSPA
jgi:L-iditol 2-dehydrogenase